jgi:hypothetical protein
MQSDLDYFSRRANEERNAARGIAHRRTREVHLELAQAYEFRLYLLRELAAMDANQTTVGFQPPPVSPFTAAAALFGDVGSPEEQLVIQPNPIPA